MNVTIKITEALMHLTDKLNIPGDHVFNFLGLAGQLEAILTVPDVVNAHYVTILGHPHSLQGGTMNNKVVTTMARAFKDMGIPSIRFNFRGVGLSAGVYDAGLGESEDMLLLARSWLQEKPETNIIFAGFSFGSYVAYRAASQCKHAMLITIAPSVHHYDYTEFTPMPAPWILLQGAQDELVPMSLIHDFIERFPAIDLLTFMDTTHFFHGKLIPLKERLIEAIRAHEIN